MGTLVPGIKMGRTYLRLTTGTSEGPRKNAFSTPQVGRASSAVFRAKFPRFRCKQQPKLREMIFKRCFSGRFSFSERGEGNQNGTLATRSGISRFRPWRMAERVGYQDRSASSPNQPVVVVSAGGRRILQVPRPFRAGVSTWEKEFNRRERREHKEKQALESTDANTRQMGSPATSTPFLCDLCVHCG